MTRLQLQSSIDDRLKAVEQQFEHLQERFSNLKIHCQDLKVLYGTQCSQSLAEGLACLLEVVACVKKADKRIIHWYNGNKGAKVALRMIGMRERTQNIINENTSKLQARLFDLERQFKSMGDIFQFGTERMDRFNQQVTQFSSDDVGATLRMAHETCNDYEHFLNLLKVEIQPAKAAAEKAKKELGIARTTLNEIKFSREMAEFESKSLRIGAATSMAGSFVAGVAAIVATSNPIGWAAIGAAYVGAIYTGLEVSDRGVKRGQDAEALKIEEAGHQNTVTAATERLKELEAKLASVETQNMKCRRAKDSVERMAKEAGEFRSEANASSIDLHNAIMGLSLGEESIRGMATELQDAGYAQTRREMATRLRQLLLRINHLHGTQNIWLDQEVVKEAFKTLGEIDKHAAVLQRVNIEYA